MIVPETICEEIFLQLPPYVADLEKPEVSKPIRYEWGDQEDLLLFLTTIAGNKYPLVWLESNKEKHDDDAHNAEKRCRFILANYSEKQTDRNPTIWKSDFVDCLNPLLENVIKCFKRSKVTTIVDNTYEVTRDANYVERNSKGQVSEERNKATDFWNVIILDITLKFIEKANGEPECINKKIFKNGR